MMIAVILMRMTTSFMIGRMVIMIVIVLVNVYHNILFSTMFSDLYKLAAKANRKRESNRLNHHGSIIVGVTTARALDKLSSSFSAALLVSPFRKHLSANVDDAIFLGRKIIITIHQ